MLAPPCSARLADLARRGRARVVTQVLVAVVETPRAARPAPGPSPRRLAAGLEGFLAGGAACADPFPARTAAAAFGAGDGYLPGQIIDRTI